MPITGVRGKGGSGKTTIVAYLLAKYFPKIQKYTNFYLKLPKTKQIDSMELFELEDYGKPVIVIWDEGYTEMDNRDSMNDDSRIKSYLLFQARKNNMSIVSITQLNIMDIRWRELEENCIYCFDRPIYNRDFSSYEGDFHYVYVSGKSASYFTLPYNSAKRVFPFFKTNQKIFPPDFEEMKRKAEMKDPKKLLKYIDKIANEIKSKSDLTKITHDTVKYAMLELGYVDFSVEKYVYARVKGKE